jgi:MoaA/NifB/PqqE/SkfB family radical SAM enzyme
MCHQKDIRACRESELSFAEAAIMFKNLKKAGINQINLVGGEFFVRQDAWKILDLIEELGFLFAIGTNAALLKTEDAARLSSYWGLTEIDISIDGPDAQTHDSIRGVPGTFDKAIAFIHDCKNFDISVMVVAVVQQQNYKKLIELANILKSIHVNTFTVVQEFSVTKKTFDDTKLTLEKLTQRDVDIFASYTVRDSTFKYDLIDFKEKMNELKVHCTKIGLNTNFAFNIDCFDSVYNETMRKDFVCGCENFGSQIDWQGNVNLCSFIRVRDLDRAQGLVGKDLLSQEDLYKTRDTILKMNMMPFCERCCGLKIIKQKNS